MDAKKTLFIDGEEVEYTTEPNLLEVIRKAGKNVPTFCYRPDLTSFGSCRMCVVEIEGRGIQSACTMPPEPGLKVSLNTERTRRVRKVSLELLLANHDRECTTCDRSGSCELQQYSEEYGIRKIQYSQKTIKEFLPIDDSNPSILRDFNKCILCGACIRACQEFQGHGVLGFSKRGSKTTVGPVGGRDLSEVDCVYCGQCQAVCPTGALTIISDIDNVWKAIVNREKKVVAQIAPSVRVAVGELFGMKPGDNVIGMLYAALKQIGFDLIFDTNFSADLTIVEEAHEFIDRVTNGGVLPMFTSCCPSWVKYLEQMHPDLIPNLSTCKSPQSMLSPLMKEILPTTYEGYTKDNIVVVSIMPCTSKKYEARRPELATDGVPHTDFVLTTQELGRMIKEAGINFNTLKPIEADSPFGQYTGAGTIFGASGGVAEAAARTAYEVVTGKTLTNVDIKEIRGVSNRFREVELDLNGQKIIVRAVSTLKEAEKTIQEIKAGKAKFHLLEVMTCPGGCINGGGQPRSCNDSSIKEKRAQGLYKEDTTMEYRKSHENPDIKKLYAEFLKSPGSHKSHELLHTHYHDQYKGSYRDLS